MDRPTSLSDLERGDRLRLMRFVCSFAWADLRIQPQERALVATLIGRLALDDEERRQVAAWLEVPPPADEVDPTAVPREHRQLFRRALESTVLSDGRITDEEREALQLFDRLTIES